MAARTGPRWWGGRWHTIFTVIVFVILASLDNAAIGLIPPLYPVIARDLGVAEAALGLVTAVSILLSAVAAVAFGYLGDRMNRKRLLLWGTVIWAGGVVMTGIAGTYAALFAWQVVTAIGLGCLASVGFSVISDFIAPRWRGLVMSLWGLSQGIGTLAGGVIAGLLGSGNWQRPFFVMGVLGLGFAVLYLLCYDPPRGRAEPELAKVFAEGGTYAYKIEWADVWRLMRRPSNIWLIMQGFFAQFAFGANVWMSRLFTARVEAEGYPLEQAVAVGALFGTLFSLGGVLSILGGWLGDLWQRKNPGGRALLSAVGMLGSIPLFVALFFLPLHGLDLPVEGSVVGAVLSSIFTSPWVAGAFLLSIGAQALNGTNSPNWFALITDANLPEHRGTVYSMGNMANGIGRAIGNGVVGPVFVALAATFAAPTNYALGLTLFQLFFIPTGICYLLAAKTTPRDIADVKETLRKRAKAAG
ncbi:MAG TPA: MFS transporter [Symbiobacteriaceae bacterium]|nr:MFS transporter [Symbiobacteriaceae bacterium]